MINVGVIGYGYWGPNLVRNFMEAKGSRVLSVCDLAESNLAKVKTRYPGIDTTTDIAKLLGNPEINLVAISTPVSTHHRLALAALKAGKNVLVEKPLTCTSAEAIELVNVSRQSKLLLAVDHTFVFTGAVRKAKELIDSGELGDVTYYDSSRVNLGLFQSDVNVLWDLAVHDLAILSFILKDQPVAVSATGISHLKGQPENTAFMTMYFDGPMIAHINVNWLSPVKIRKTLIGGTKKMIVYDDLEPSDKIRIYDKGITVTDTPEGIYALKVGYRTGDVLIPTLDGTEALRAEVAHLADCIENGKAPIADGVAGLRVVQVLEAATESIRNRGQLVELKPLEGN
jgi:predicted dehydrogenase